MFNLADYETVETRLEKFIKDFPDFRILLGSGYEFYQGKVRDLFKKGDDLYLFHTDRLTAFDRSICDIPQRGIILAALTKFWMAEASKIIPTQRIESIDGRTLKVETAEPVKIELVIRGYLAGSMLRAYKKGERHFCGHTLPEGLKDYGPLPSFMITPTTKAAVFEHDQDISEDEILKQKLCTPDEWPKIKHYAGQLFKCGQEIYEKAGWILADTKYEFGRRKNGDIILIDECHTPDSSRLWNKALSREGQPKMFDKEIVRSYLAKQGFTGEGTVPAVPKDVKLDLALSYLDVAESILGSVSQYGST